MPKRLTNGYEAEKDVVQTSADAVTTTSWSYRLTVVKSSVTVNSFSSGVKVWMRVRGIGTAGPGPWSDPAVKTVP